MRFELVMRLSTYYSTYSKMVSEYDFDVFESTKNI